MNLPSTESAGPPHALPFIIKICGITSVDDGQNAVDAGATALGFNFYRQSSRYVSFRDAANQIDEIEGKYLRVGVFVNATAFDLLEALSIAPLDILQLHGSVPEELPQNCRIWRAVASDSRPVANAAFEAYLLDTPCSGFGGSGLCFDWSLTAGFPARFVLAGGLHSSNVAEAIAATHPSGVDACSKLESSPGRKDTALVRAFIRAASEAHRQLRANEMILTA